MKFETYRVTNLEELRNAYNIVFRKNTPAFIEILVDKNEIPISLRKGYEKK